MRTTHWGGSVALALGVIVFSAAESAAQRYLPPGHRPGPGECRVWIDGVPPGHQPAPFRCERGRRIVWSNHVREAYLDWYLTQPWGYIDLRLDWDRYGLRAAFWDVRAILEFERFHRARYLRADWRRDRYWDRYYDGYRDVRWRVAYRDRFVRDIRDYRRSGRAPVVGRAVPRVQAPRVYVGRGDRDDRWDDRRDRWEDRRERARDRWEDRRDRDDDDRWEDRRRDRDDRGRRGGIRRDDDRRGPPGNRGRGNGRGNRGNGRGNGGR